MCLLSKSPEQQHLVDQVSVSPLPDNCLLVARTLQADDDMHDFAITDTPSVGGIISFGSRTLITGWRAADGLVASVFEHQPPTDLLHRENHRAIAHDDDLIDPTREVQFKLQMTENENDQSQQPPLLLHDLSVSLRSVTHRVLTPNTSAQCVAQVVTDGTADETKELQSEAGDVEQSNSQVELDPDSGGISDADTSVVADAADNSIEGETQQIGRASCRERVCQYV